MSQHDHVASNPYAMFGTPAIAAPADEKLAFIRKTYVHLAAAIYGFVALEYFFFSALPLDQWMEQMFLIQWAWMAMIIAFMVVGAVANRWAMSDASPAMQYAGLVLYVFAEAVITAPLLWMANKLSLEVAGQTYNPIAVAGVLTLLTFGVLTATVFLTRKDFSFLAPALGIAAIVMLVLIGLSFFGILNLGMAFWVFGVVLAAGYVLYYTSNVLHHYRTDQYVAASLALFAAVALLFWYILRIVMAFSRR